MRRPILNSPRLSRYYARRFFLNDPDRVIATIAEILSDAAVVETCPPVGAVQA